MTTTLYSRTAGYAIILRPGAIIDIRPALLRNGEQGLALVVDQGPEDHLIDSGPDDIDGATRTRLTATLERLVTLIGRGTPVVLIDGLLALVAHSMEDGPPPEEAL